MEYAINVRVTSTASPDLLFAHVAVAEAWSVWSGMPLPARRLRPGFGALDGVGAIRRIGPVREETVTFDPPGHYAYRMLAGLPVDDYRADVTFEPREGGGTTIRWEARFASRVPGTGAPLRSVMERVILRFARRIGAHAERCGAGCPAHRG
ncbi:SRPBCC family protein [Thermomonospora umbrina]|uniref:Polyketide cyclase/dehydrase/lipid transport protein n=1 Tax=Thermomonospora umbrina TaxID=111806 RepID=A0A3D9T333_9ACTN|nr:SRPBCC family protein [Thermomonospora umbrina]REE98231.1 polyketide cyclase/dehydrase/lipid transport protein [Thermomonospora umbrina]